MYHSNDIPCVRPNASICPKSSFETLEFFHSLSDFGLSEHCRFFGDSQLLLELVCSHWRHRPVMFDRPNTVETGQRVPIARQETIPVPAIIVEGKNCPNSS